MRTRYAVIGDGKGHAAPLSVAFESGQLTYSNHEVDLYNSGINQILSVAASRGHSIRHFTMDDVFPDKGVPYARTSVLRLPKSFSGDRMEAHKHLRKTGEELVPLSSFHLVFMRADDVKPGTPNLDCLYLAEQDSIFLESTRATLDTCDKYELVRRCPDAPSPVTFKADSVEEAISCIGGLPDSEGRFVLKDRFGYGCGAQVHLMRFEDPDLEQTVGRYVRKYGNVLLQEYCPEVREGDLVVTFFDGEHLGTMKRTAKEGEWKTNASLGAEELRCELTGEQLEIAKHVADSFKGCRFSSVDMFPSGKVIEINAFPGGRGLLKLYGVSVGDIVFDGLEKEALFKFSQFPYKREAV